MINAATVQGRPLLRSARVLCGAYSRAAFIRGAAFIQGNTVLLINKHLACTSALTLSLPNMQVYLLKHCSRQVMDSTEIELLTKVYSKLYAVLISALDVPNCYLKYSSALINGRRLGSHKSHSASSCIVIWLLGTMTFLVQPEVQSLILKEVDITRAI